LKKSLVIIAHPNIEKSRGNKGLRDTIMGDENIKIHELYKEYPDFKIDAAKEQNLLMQYDNIILQFPFYWYSTPPLLKLWLDAVINDDLFKTDPAKSDMLSNKTFQLALTVGRVEERYFPVDANYKWDEEVKRPYIKPSLIEKHGKEIMNVFLSPLEQSAHLAGMGGGYTQSHLLCIL
jgi:putative NADPH-quinone reductase